MMDFIEDLYFCTAYPVFGPTEDTFFCLTCKALFKNSEMRNMHYKTEWHRYNLHRKINGLPPIKFEAFQDKCSTFNKDNANEREKIIIKCKLCRKKFTNKKQYNNHILSKNHKKKMVEEEKTAVSSEDLSNVKNKVRIDIDSDTESLDSNEWLNEFQNPIECNDCLFCDHHSRSVTCNLKHMMVEHTFFVPDLEYCIDKKGLLLYLGKKICFEYKCIWCNNSGRQLQSVEAVRSHMIDKGHCKMLFEGETLLEYMPFYNYLSRYPDADPNTKPDVILAEDLDGEGYELKLPSGKIVGHRDLVHYYKQNLGVVQPVRVTKDGEKMRKLLLQYKALGDANMQMETTKKRIRDIQYLQKFQSKYSTQLQFKQNKLQTHFRQQINY